MRSPVSLFVAVLALSAGCKPDRGSSSAPSSTPSGIASSAPSAALGTPHRDEAGRYEVAMPGTPKVEEVPSKLLSTAMHMASAKAGAATYYVMWFDFPVGAEVNVPGAFEGAQVNVSKQDEVTVTSTREFTFAGGLPARDVVAESTNGKPWKDVMRFVFADRRMYSVFVRGVDDEARARAFLDSFHLLAASHTEAPWVTGTLGPATASFPETPREATKPTPGPDGPMDVRTLRVTRGGLDMGLQVVVDPKPGPEASADPEARLDGARDTFAAGLQVARVARDEKTTVGGKPARRLTFELGHGRGSMEATIVFSKRDTMVVAMAAISEAATAAEHTDALRFLDSFDLAKP